MIGTITVAKRLTLGFSIQIVFLTLAILFGLWKLGAQNEMTSRIVTVDWKKTVLANEIIDLMNANARQSFLLLHVSDRKPIVDTIRSNATKVSEKITALDNLLYRAEGKTLMRDVTEKREAYVKAMNNVSSLLDAGREAEATRAMINETVPRLEQALDAINRLILFQDQLLEESGQASESIFKTSRTQFFILLAVAIAASAVLARWIVLSVTTPLGGEPETAKRIVENIANGDLSHAVPVKPGDSHSLLAAMHTMQEKLRTMLRELQANAEGVAAASDQLSTTSRQVAAATSAQSEASSSMAAAVEQLTVSVNHVSDQARQAHSITQETEQLSVKGNQVIQQTSTEIQEIASIVSEAQTTIEVMGEKSQEISGIVQVIKDVADQTNLLALNAAIEAARAGEQGRGFAVVADEVRKLAERTAKATTEISRMIEAVQENSGAAVETMQQAVSRVAEGVEMTRNASASIVAISDGAQNVLDVVVDISNALKEQSTASNDVASNVERIAQMSEENSAATREVADTAVQLQSLAAQSRTAISRFTL